MITNWIITQLVSSLSTGRLLTYREPNTSPHTHTIILGVGGAGKFSVKGGAALGGGGSLDHFPTGDHTTTGRLPKWMEEYYTFSPPPPPDDIKPRGGSIAKFCSQAPDSGEDQQLEETPHPLINRGEPLKKVRSPPPRMYPSTGQAPLGRDAPPPPPHAITWGGSPRKILVTGEEYLCPPPSLPGSM